MAVVLTAPGVYIDELGSGVRTITGVATSVTAFVGRCRRGTVASDAAPILVSSWPEFVRRCGDVWPDSELPTAVQQYFQAGGASALIVRVVHTGGAVPADDAASASFDLGGGTLLTARSAGAWANTLLATVSHGGALDTAGPQEFHLTISLLDPDDGSVSVLEEHRWVSVDPTSARFVTRVLQTRSRAVVASSVGAARPLEVANAIPAVGRDGDPPTDTEVEDALARLRLADIVNLLCIPPYTDPEVGPNLSVYTAALSLCEELRA
ncbi:MAG: hypothetical protein JKY37_12395, partial [Nannocystaceae bacterium]|nr:hypothetical protein [Nannocystaceae bacterium]